MACENCQDTPQTFTTSYRYNPICGPKNPCQNGTPIDSACVIYRSNSLECVGITSGDNVEVALQKINDYICANTPEGFGTYNYSCLIADGTINTQKQFVERVSAKVCSVDTNLNTFINTTFPQYQNSITAQIDAINNPGVVCASAGVVGTDSLKTVLTKYCTKFSDIDNKISLSDVVWGDCFTITSLPSTIAQAFTLIEQQLCTLKTQGIDVDLPTFDNTESCLANPTSADSLVDTIDKIKTKLCETATDFDPTQLTFGCVATPSTLNLTNVIGNILTKVSSNTQGTITQVVGGTLSNVDNNNLCLGKVLTITGGGTSTDRLVAATPSDTAPGTLQDKLESSDSSVSFTYGSDNKVNIKDSGKVLVSSGDSTKGLLVDKLQVNNSGSVSLQMIQQGTTNQNLLLSANINYENFIPELLNTIKNSTTYQALFCTVANNCTATTIDPIVIADDTSIDETETTTVSMRLLNSDGTFQDVTSLATFTSSNASVATVSGHTVTGVSQGEAIITGTYLTYAATTGVVVSDHPPY